MKPQEQNVRSPRSVSEILSFRSLSRLLSILTTKERRSLYLNLAGVLIVGLIDVMGLSSILPFMAVVAKPQSVHDIGALNWAYRYSGVSTINEFMLVMGIGCLAIVLFSNAVGFLVQSSILRFSFGVSRELSLRMLSRYLAQPYVFFLNRNSAALLVSTTGEVEGIVNGVLIPGLQAISKIVTACFVLVVVVVVDPVLALVFLSIFGGAYVVIFAMTRRRIAYYGEQSQIQRRSLLAAASEAFNGIKELTLLGRENYYLDRFADLSAKLRTHQVRYNTIATLPRYLIEATAFGAIIFVVLFLLKTGRDIQSAIPLLVLYAFTGYRLMPAFQALFQNLTIVRFNWPSVELLATEVRELEKHSALLAAQPESTISLAFERCISLQDVAFAYPGAGQPVVKNIGLQIDKNTTVGFVGETGAGKSTIADIILSILPPCSGQLTVDGVLIDDGNRRQWQENLGYVPQQGFLSDASIASNIAFGVQVQAIDMSRVERAARVAQLHDFIVRLPEGYQTVVGERGVRLSGGQRQRIAIARALYRDPAVLVFDEATSALDGLTEEAIVDAIRLLAHKKTIITIAHRLSTVRECDMIYLLEDGRIVDSGKFHELIARNKTFQGMAKYSDGQSYQAIANPVLRLQQNGGL